MFTRTAIVLLLSLFILQPAHAQRSRRGGQANQPQSGLSAGDQQQLDLFDRNYDRLSKDKSAWSTYMRIKNALHMDLEYVLDQVSDAGKHTDAWKERKLKLDQAYQYAANLFGVPQPKPAVPAPTAEEEELLERMDGLRLDRTLWSTSPDGLRRLGKSRAERTLAEIEELATQLRPEVAQHGHVTHRTKHLPEMRENLRLAFAAEDFNDPQPGAASGDQPAPAEAWQAFQSFLAAHRAELEGAAPGQDELSLRITWTLLRNLQRELARQVGQTSCLEARQAAWEVGRLRHALDVAFGRCDDFPDNSLKELDRFSSIEHELQERIWPTTVDPLRWQDEKKLQAMQKTLSEYRLELDRLEPRFRRTKAYAEAVCEHRAAVARLDREVAASLAKAAEAGDVDGQLTSYQETFPKDAFDPSFKGTETASEVRRWGEQLRNWRDGIDHALAFFELAKASSVKAREKAFQDYVAWFKLRVAGCIEGAANARSSQWESKLKAGLETAQHEFDMGDTEAFKLQLLQKLEEGVRGAQLLAAFREGYTGESSAASLQEQTTQIIAGRDRMVAQAASILESRVLPDAVSEDSALLAVARDRVADLVGEGNFRGLRITASPWHYDYREISGNYLITTWWEAFRVDFAARPRGGGDHWFHESFVIERRLDSLDAPISGWRLLGSEPSLSLEILPKNIH